MNGEKVGRQKSEDRIPDTGHRTPDTELISQRVTPSEMVRHLFFIVSLLLEAILFSPLL